ncbi:MAG: hypothetical protein EBU46_18005 [Nitrosomonadaceae bacterium]|nr:hypothetical protein [Nitrosomonadaceae bacterium]
MRLPLRHTAVKCCCLRKSLAVEHNQGLLEQQKQLLVVEVIVVGRCPLLDGLSSVAESEVFETILILAFGVNHFNDSFDQ